VWLPPGARADPAFASVVATAQAAGVPLQERSAGVAEAFGDLRVRVLWPPPDALPASRNDGSLVLRVELAGAAVLLPGDVESGAEARLLAAGAPLAAEIVKLPHHGSRSSSSAAFLAAAGGSVAIVSAPRAGRFGMPHAEVVTRAGAAGYAVWWTGRDGAVLVGLEPVVHVQGWRE
jgi:competence protein ComEC